MFFGSKKPDTPAAGSALPQNEAIIFDSGLDDFEARVLLASMEKPVIVDFWAPWCGPCKQLMPTLEKAVTALAGKVLMAKVNIDDNQQLAAMLRVQSVPTVFAFFKGQPIDAFQGNIPESQIKEFLGKVLDVARQGNPAAIDIPEALKAAANALATGDAPGAHATYARILQEDQNNIEALIGMVRVYIAAGQLEQAQSLIAMLPPDIKESTKFAPAITALDLALSVPKGSASEIEAALAKNPADHEQRFKLAEIQFAGGQRQEAIDNLLLIIEKKRDWNEDAARKQLVKYFEAMGHDDPLTIEARKKLSAILFS